MRSRIAELAALVFRAPSEIWIRRGGPFGDSEEGRRVATYFSLLGEHGVSQFPATRHYIGKYRGEVVATGTLFVGEVITKPPSWSSKRCSAGFQGRTSS